MSSVPVTAVSDCSHRRLQHPRLNRDNIVDDSVAAGAVGVLAVTTYLQLRWVLAWWQRFVPVSLLKSPPLCQRNIIGFNQHGVTVKPCTEAAGAYPQ